MLKNLKSIQKNFKKLFEHRFIILDKTLMINVHH
jgi:hypothetical protein